MGVFAGDDVKAGTMVHGMHSGREGSLFPIPILTTSSLDDLCLLVAGLPVWWALGVEQLMWPLFGLLILLKLVLGDKLVRLGPAGFLLLAFIGCQLVSGLFIVEGYRLVTFVRNLSAYVGAFSVFVVTRNVVTSTHALRRVLKALVFAVGVCAILCLVIVVSGSRPTFNSPLGYLLPASVVGTTYGGKIAHRVLGADAWFVGLGTYYRLEGFFLFATFYATVISLTLPALLWLRRSRTSAVSGVLYSLMGALLVVNLVLTTGRVAILAGCFGALLYGILFSRWRRAILLGGTLASIAGGVFVATHYEEVKLATEAAAFARGAGSVNQREAVYRETLSGIAERPVFGWGTERDIPGRPFPAGSHSYYLGITYKHGLAGLLVFLTMWLAVVMEARVVGSVGRLVGDGALEWQRYGAWVIPAILANGMTDVLDLDTSTLAVVWLLIGTFVAARGIVDRHMVNAT